MLVWDLFWGTIILIMIPIAANFGLRSGGTILSLCGQSYESYCTRSFPDHGAPIEQQYIDKPIEVNDNSKGSTEFAEAQPQNSLSPQTKYLIAFALLFTAVCIACPPAGAGLGAIFAACHMGVIFHAINVGINVGPTLKAMHGIVLSMKFFLVPACLMTSKKLMTGKKMLDFKEIERTFEKIRAAFSGSSTQQTPQNTTPSADGPPGSESESLILRYNLFITHTHP